MFSLSGAIPVPIKKPKTCRKAEPESATLLTIASPSVALLPHFTWFLFFFFLLIMESKLEVECKQKNRTASWPLTFTVGLVQWSGMPDLMLGQWTARYNFSPFLQFVPAFTSPCFCPAAHRCSTLLPKCSVAAAAVQLLDMHKTDDRLKLICSCIVLVETFDY